MSIFKKKENWKKIEEEYVRAFREHLRAKKTFQEVQTKIIRQSPKKTSSSFSPMIEVIFVPEGKIVDPEIFERLFPDVYGKVLKTRVEYSYTKYTGPIIEI